MKKVALLILDGWGIGKKDKADAIYHAKTPVFDQLLKDYPNNYLLTHGGHVGLPDGQMGNSEVGHLNIGAGRIVYQELTRINKVISDQELPDLANFQKAIAQAKGKTLHFIGLLSKGGVHSHQDHLVALINEAHQQGVENIVVHAFTDGRDCDPRSGKGYLSEFEEAIAGKAKIASVIGRYYAMDRDNRWERVAKAYHLLVNGEGKSYPNVESVFETQYGENITDEFLDASKIENQFQAIQEGDTVLCFNFRTDRCREISIALTQEGMHEHNMHTLDLNYYTLTEYDKNFKNVNVIFEKDLLKNTLGEVLSKNGKTQLRIAETEKYPHVTFFFSGGREAVFEAEHRILCPSPKVATYDLQPEMSALEIKDNVINDINTKTPDFICLNFANPDMVGHTGVYEAIQKAVETVDTCLGEVVNAALAKDYSLIVIADHGNADNAVNADGSPNTAHSVNPVPFILVDKDIKEVNNGILGDVAPTVLDLMQIEKAPEMTGTSLIQA